MILSYIEQKNFILTKIQIPIIDVHKLLQFKYLGGVGGNEEEEENPFDQS